MNSQMRHELQRLLNILQQHSGKEKAISMLDLYEQYTGNRVDRDQDGKPTQNVPTLSRSMRHLIDELIEVHAIPVMSSSRGGYWLVTDEQELAEVTHQFMSRGISSLQKAARLKKISLAEALRQMALDLEAGDAEQQKHQEAKSL
ncbi:MAG: hypothetical protein SV201_04845 [Pseudomonadota bacterium]|nr:hypothetical protein [Pseudomonadota bacterium]